VALVSRCGIGISFPSKSGADEWLGGSWAYMGSRFLGLHGVTVPGQSSCCGFEILLWHWYLRSPCDGSVKIVGMFQKKKKVDQQHSMGASKWGRYLSSGPGMPQRHR
jgi:hypothetical protein